MRDPRSKLASRWSWIVVLLVGLALFAGVQWTLVATGNPNLVPALLLLGATVVPVSFVAFIAARPVPYAIGTGTVGLTALFGGVVGVVVASTLEYDTLRTLGVVPTIAIGAIEEAAKLVVPAALVLVLRPARPADGLVLGVASGAGFAALETMGYAFVTLVESGGRLDAVDGVLLLRGLLSPAAHMAWTGLTAAALWRAAARGWRPRALAGFVLVYLAAVALHAAWDGVGSPAVYAVLAAVSLGWLIRTTRRVAVRPDAVARPDGS